MSAHALVLATRLRLDFKGFDITRGGCVQRRRGYGDVVAETGGPLVVSQFLPPFLARPRASAASMALRTFSGVMLPAS